MIVILYSARLGNARKLTKDDVQSIEGFILLCDRTWRLSTVDKCRKILFTKKVHGLMDVFTKQ